MNPPNDNVTPLFSFDVPAPAVAAAESIMEAEPEVQQHAIDQHLQTQGESEVSQPSGASSDSAKPADLSKIDSAGTVFDDRIHSGTKLKNGTWRVKKSAKAAGPSVVGKPTGKSTTAVAADPTAQTLAAATLANQITIMTFQMIFDRDEWATADDEHKMMTEAWYIYLSSKNITEVPPGLLLAVAIGGYAAKRIREPKTAEKVGRFKTWIALRVTKWKVKREFAKRGIKAIVSIKNGVLTVDGKPLESQNDKH